MKLKWIQKRSLIKDFLTFQQVNLWQMTILLHLVARHKNLINLETKDLRTWSGSREFCCPFRAGVIAWRYKCFYTASNKASMLNMVWSSKTRLYRSFVLVRIIATYVVIHVTYVYVRTLYRYTHESRTQVIASVTWHPTKASTLQAPENYFYALGEFTRK